MGRPTGCESYNPERLGGLTPAELGYIAGIVDGEGYIGARMTINQRGRPSLKIRLCVANTDRSLVGWLRDKCGGSVTWLHQQPKAAHHKPVAQWELSTRGAPSLLRLVLPYLVIKSDRAALAIRLSELIDEVRIGGRKKGVPEDNTKERIVLIEELRRLNKKGVA